MNKAAKAALAKENINEVIPSILASDERARKGVEAAQLIRGHKDLLNLSSFNLNPTTGNFSSKGTLAALTVILIECNTLNAAQVLHTKNSTPKTAVLNMASPLQPGGGVLRGAKAQEESLCMRSTL